jgi:hypothetical protein
MTEEKAAPQPERLLLSTRREYLHALEQLIGLAQRELRILDADLFHLQLDSTRTNDLLREFLLRGRDNRLYIAVHHTEYLSNHCPRLLELLRRFSEHMFIHQTMGDATRAQDCLVLADKHHFVRRPVQAQPRAVLRLNDEMESQAIYLRFSEIWDSSVPAVAATTSGL